MACYVLRKGGLDRAGAEPKADTEDGMYHIIDTQTFSSNSAGQKNPIKKSENPAGKSGSGQQDRASQKCTFLWRKGNGWHNGSRKTEN